MAHIDYPHEAGQLYGCAECDDVARQEVADRAGIDRDDVRGTFGEYTIDGMDADEWIEAMFSE